MFGLFKSVPFSDPVLGELTRAGGLWRGTLPLDSGPVVLALEGTRAGPDPAALGAAREVPARLPTWRPAIEAALFEHYEPYAAAVAAGDVSADAFPSVTSPVEVWPHVSLEFISISKLDGSLTTELGYAAAWDEEHTLGARFADGGLTELNGSVLPP